MLDIETIKRLHTIQEDMILGKIIIPNEEPKKECCKDITGFYLGMTCTVCNEPFRIVNIKL